MLIESLGTIIVNSTDSKGRWEASPTSRLFNVVAPLLLTLCVSPPRTALHAAAFSDHVECVSLLLSHGAQANVVDAHLRRTPLMMAALNGQTNTVGQCTTLAHRHAAGCLISPPSDVSPSRVLQR